MDKNQAVRPSHVVYGCTVAGDKRNSILLAKFDLGNRAIAFMIPSSVAHFLMEKITFDLVDDSACTAPEVAPSDWNGANSPMALGAVVTQFQDGLLIRFETDKGEVDGLVFNPGNLRVFMESISEYREYLKFPQDASDTKH